MTASENYNAAFARLAKSKFRSRFHLAESDRAYIESKGMETIRRHCEDFIRTRLAPPILSMTGDRLRCADIQFFVAQHACACYCRDCLVKWECAHAVGVGFPEREARTSQGPQGAAKVPRGVAIPAERH